MHGVLDAGVEESTSPLLIEQVAIGFLCGGNFSLADGRLVGGDLYNTIAKGCRGSGWRLAWTKDNRQATG